MQASQPDRRPSGGSGVRGGRAPGGEAGAAPQPAPLQNEGYTWASSDGKPKTQGSAWGADAGAQAARPQPAGPAGRVAIILDVEPLPSPSRCEGGRAARGSASDAGHDDAEGVDYGDSDSAKGCSEAEPDGRVNLSPVPGCSLVEASRNCAWSQGMLVRTITQKWRPH